MLILKAHRLQKTGLDDSVTLIKQYLHRMSVLLRRRYSERGPDWHNPSAEWVRNAEKNAALENKLLRWLKEEYTPQDNDERLSLTYICYRKKMNRAAATLYADAFAAEPKRADDLNERYRDNATSHAVLAAAGQGADAANLDDNERKRLREQARLWLDAQHKQLAGLLNEPSPRILDRVRKDLEKWQRDPDLASVRGDAIAKLPEVEQEAWRQLWKDIANTLTKAREKTSAELKPQKNP